METQAVSLAQATNNIKHQIAAIQLGGKPSGQPFPKVVIETGRVALVNDETSATGDKSPDLFNDDANQNEQLMLEFD